MNGNTHFLPSVVLHSEDAATSIPVSRRVRQDNLKMRWTMVFILIDDLLTLMC